MKTTGTSTNAGDAFSGAFLPRLQAEFERRRHVNPRYSLRAFAMHLGTDHSTLSQVLRGRRALTARTIERFGARLGLDRDAVAAAVADEARRSPHAASQTSEVRRLAADTANVLADWYHWAILELVRLRDFVPDSRWIARMLGITVDEVNVAVARLLHLGLLEMSAPDRWTDRCGDSAANFEDFSRAAVQRLSEQVHVLSLAARDVPPALREHSTTTIAVRADRIPEALTCIARFRAELLALLERDAERDDVYQLEIGFFPVTRIQTTKETDDGPSRDEMADPGEEP